MAALNPNREIQNRIEALKRISQNQDVVNYYVRINGKYRLFSDVFPWLFCTGQDDSKRKRRQKTLFVNLANISEHCEEKWEEEKNVNELQCAQNFFAALHIPVDGHYRKLTFLFAYLIHVFDNIGPTYHHTDDVSKNIFVFLTDFCLRDTKVVMMFHTPSGADQQNGRALHGGNANTTQDVVENMKKELIKILPELDPKRNDGVYNGSVYNLRPWIKQGVLLLNAKLTYMDDVWTKFTDSIVNYICMTVPHVVFILAGLEARQKRNLIDETRHLVLELYHPTANDKPIEGRRWEFCMPFTQANLFLTLHNIQIVNWASLSEDEMVGLTCELNKIVPIWQAGVSLAAWLSNR